VSNHRAAVVRTWSNGALTGGKTGGAGQTSDQHETTRFTTPLNLQNLHPRFKSGRRLHPSRMIQAKGAPRSLGEAGPPVTRKPASGGKPPFAYDSPEGCPP
jgi:hypothetical protein